MPAATPSLRSGGGRLRVARQHASRWVITALFLAPAAVLLGWLLVYPTGEVVHLAFTSWDGSSSPQSVGFENFTELFKDHRFTEALVHNLLIVASMPVWIAVPYGVAWVLHSEIRGWRFFRLAFFLPIVLSPVVIGLYYGIVLKDNGPLNSALRSVGLGFLAHEWLNDPSLALPVVITVIIWSTFGIGVLIFLGGFGNLDRDQIDAARIDGASNFQIQRHVVFWQILPLIEFWAVLIVILSFTAFFPLIYTLTRGGPGFATYTVDFDLYQEAFSSGQFGYASAIGVMLMVMIALVAGLTIGLLRSRRR